MGERRGGALPLGGVDGVVERLALKSGAFPLWQCSLTFELFPTVMNHCCNISRCQCILFTASQSQDVTSKTNIHEHPYFVGFKASFRVACPAISLHTALRTSYMKLETKAKILIEIMKLKEQTHHFISFPTCHMHSKVERKNVTCKLHSSCFSPESDRMISISVRRTLMFRLPFFFLWLLR